MAIWDYIAQYNPTGFYEDNRSKTLKNDYMDVKISAANRENEREKKIMELEDAVANGDKSKLAALGVYAPEKRGKMIDNEEKMVEYARPFAQAYMQASPENKAKVYGQIYGKLKDVMDVSDMPMQWNENVDGIMETLANADPTKIQQERQAEIARQAQQDAYSRQIGLLNYQRSMANQETADKVRKIQEAMASGRISPEQGQAALNELELGIKPIASSTPNMMKSLLDISKMQISPEAKSKIAQMAGLGEVDFNKPIPELEAAAAIKEQYPELTDEQALSIAFRNKGTTVNVNNNAGQDKFIEEMAKKDAASVAKNEESIDALDKQLTLLDQMEAAIADINLYQGTGGEAMNTLKTVLSSAGYDVKGMDSASILNTGSSMLMGNLRKDLMPGPLSDRDLQFLIKMTPSLTKRPEQNQAIVNMYKKAYRRQKAVMEFQNNYARQNKTLDGWREAAKKFGLDKPIFTAEEKAMAQGKMQYRKEPTANQFSDASDDEILSVLGGY